MLCLMPFRLLHDQAQELSRFAFLVVHDLARPALIGGMLQNLRKRNWRQTTVFVSTQLRRLPEQSAWAP